MSDPSSNFQNPVVWDGVSGNSLAGPWTEYMWLVIVGAIVAFGMAWGIGANDVANAFGTAVGAKTLTLWQACLIAAVFEFSGAVALGDEVTKTVAGSIADPADFTNVPEVFAYGMLCALIAAGTWITTATYLELAVSTTHSIIGAVLGFALVFGGGGAINWGSRSDTFPFVSGLVPVVISWFTSPILAGVLSALFFLANRTLILRREHAHIIAFWALPPLVACTVFIGVFFVLIKGTGEEATDSLSRAAWISGAAGGGAGLACTPLLVWLHRRQTTRQDRIQDAVDITPEVATSAKDWQANTEPPTYWARIKARILYSLTFDVHQDVHRDLRVATMHSAAEVFDPRAEEVFKYLQVFSSCCVSFAHGANDVANAVGPFAAIWYVYQTHTVASSVPVPQWILALGGAGIVVGLATYGYNIIKVLGVKMAKMTPSRGYCAEIATALTVAVASLFGLPVSTTHAIVGAEVGVGMMEGVKQGTNYQLLAKTICAWVFTLAIAGLVSAAIFAFGIHTPNVTNLDAAATYESIIIQTSIRLVQQLNATNYANQATIGRFDPVLNQSLAIAMANLTQLTKPGVINMDLLDAVSNATAWIYATQTVPTVGFKRNETYNTSTAITVPGW